MSSLSYLLGWGSASDGQLGGTANDILVPRPISQLPTSSPIIDFIPGVWQSLFITRDGVYKTTPPNNYRPLPPVLLPSPILHQSHPPPSFITAATGRDFCLLLSSSGHLYVYGTGAFGELGLGDCSSVPVPTQIQSLSHVKIIAVVAADFHWLALDSTGAVFSCGQNASRQLGLAHSNHVRVPTRVTTLWPHPIVQISTGDSHSAALSADGQLFCFGSNKDGQLGNASFRVRVASSFPALVPMPCSPSATATTNQPSSSSSSSFNNSANAMDIDTPQPSSSTTTPATTPTSVISAAASSSQSLSNSDDQQQQPRLFFVDVACGSAHTIALRNDGAVFCWGKGENGQLGSRTTRTMYEPSQIRISVSFVSVSAGDRHSAALTSDGRLFMWGDGSAGQLGYGDIGEKYVPIELPPPRIPDHQSVEPLRFLKVRCGGSHTLALVGDQSMSTHDAFESYPKRIPRCILDNMLHSKAGLSRFGSAGVLLRTFVKPDVEHFSPHKVDYIAVETAHISFLRMFGDDGKQILRICAARIRHQAQVAFGLVRDRNVERCAFGEDENDNGNSSMSWITPRNLVERDDTNFRSSVANANECGYLLFIALMNPIYNESHCTADLAELAVVLSRCEEGAREAFLETVSHCEEGVLVNRLIRPLQCVITSELRGNQRVTRNANFATKMLALCYHGTWRKWRRKRSRGFLFPHKEFYNETVSERVDFEGDYDRWMGNQEIRRMENGGADDNHHQYMNQNGLRNFNVDNDNCSETENEYSAMDLISLPTLPEAGREERSFAFCSYSFLLTKEAKFKILQNESRRTMTTESRRSLLSFGAAQLQFGRMHPHIHFPAEQLAHLQYLVLMVQRSDIVADTYNQVAYYAQNQPRELHKPLKVIFHGEEGVDEGGVSKEFYQELMEKILKPDYGMFEYYPETRFHWFRKDFLEPEESWQLIGIMFGLAAFNSILLDVQFPPVVYRKLAVAIRNAHTANSGMLSSSSTGNDSNGGRGGGGGTRRRRRTTRIKPELEDVIETFPPIGNSLRQIREYEGDDVEEVFGLTFEVPYTGLFGVPQNVQLIENGAKTPVTNANREEFIYRYCDFLINTSIERAFEQFAHGFVFMLNGPFVNELTADDLETLVIGERELDFSGLRQAAKYEGYDAQSPIITNLWHVLDEYDEEMKQLFLAFVTGTDRAPIGGLQKLRLLIQRHGADSNRLPSSRTCFNVLLLPEYNTRAKLRDRLSVAVRNSHKGFGVE